MRKFLFIIALLFPFNALANDSSFVYWVCSSPGHIDSDKRYFVTSVFENTCSDYEKKESPYNGRTIALILDNWRFLSL